MRNRYKFYQEFKHGLTSFSNHFLDQENIDVDNEPNYEQAKEILMSIPDEQETVKSNVIDMRALNNGSDITRWNQHHLRHSNKENQAKRKGLRKDQERHISSQNSFAESQNSQFNIGYSLKRELNKLQFPLKEKNINSEQFRRSQFEKQRNKTRNEIKLQIINSKFELAPTIQSKKKVQTQYGCEHIVKFRTENSHYHRIKRKGLFTIDLEQQKTHEQSTIKNLSRTREKIFFLRNQLESYPRNRQNSIHLLFSGMQ